MTEKTVNYRETVLIVGTFIIAIGALFTFITLRDSDANPHYRDYGRSVQSAKV